MTLAAISIDFVCEHCQKQIINATLNDIWYAAGRPNCSRECQRAELERMAHETRDDPIVPRKREATPS